jgi:adenylosuccinate synthase
VGLGVLELDRSAFTDQVVADSSIDIPTKAYCTPVGVTPMPTDLSEVDLSKWNGP